MLASLISIPCIALASGYRDGRQRVFWLGFGVLWVLVMLPGLPIGPEVRLSARVHLRTVSRLVGGVAACVGLLSRAIDGGSALALLLVSALVELLMRGKSALGALRARLNRLVAFVSQDA
jgi:hypothetical protein